MIEMLGVLAIIAVLSVGGIAGYSNAMSSFKHNKWRHQVETLIFNIKDAYKNERTYTEKGLSVLSTMKSIGIVPQDMLDKNNKDLFGNGVQIIGRDWNGYTRMNLQFNMPPSKDAVQNCHDLLQLVPIYTNYLWVVGVCTGNCGYFFYRICGKVAPENYIRVDTCRDYDVAKVMEACSVCAKQNCTALVLFDNNS